MATRCCSPPLSSRLLVGLVRQTNHREHFFDALFTRSLVLPSRATKAKSRLSPTCDLPAAKILKDHPELPPQPWTLRCFREERLNPHTWPLLMPKEAHRTGPQQAGFATACSTDQVHKFTLTHIHLDVLQDDVHAVPDGHVIEPNEWSVTHQRWRLNASSANAGLKVALAVQWSWVVRPP